MSQYIDKDTLVAEIKKLIEMTKMLRATEEIRNARLYAFTKILSSLDTLEVKEVDLNNEATHYLLYEHRSPLNEIMHKADLKTEIQYHKDIENAFKAGFELGMSVSIKAQKGEKV